MVDESLAAAFGLVRWLCCGSVGSTLKGCFGGSRCVCVAVSTPSSLGLEGTPWLCGGGGLLPVSTRERLLFCFRSPRNTLVNNSSG